MELMIYWPNQLYMLNGFVAYQKFVWVVNCLEC
jgi:hypothetical protein